MPQRLTKVRKDNERDVSLQDRIGLFQAKSVEGHVGQEPAEPGGNKAARHSPLVPLEHKCYADPDHCDAFFSALNSLRDEGLLLDCSLLLLGRPFGAHSLALASVSRVARGWLKSGQVTMGTHLPQPDVVGLDGKVTAVGLQAVLHFAYTGEARSGPEETGEVLEACGWLEVDRFTHCCMPVVVTDPLEVMKKAPSARCEREKNLRVIRELWEKGIGCDVKLQADGVSFQAHRVALAACGDFFRAMFLSGMKEAFQREVHMPTMPPTALSSLLGFIYSGSLLLSWDNVFEVTEAALRYQVLGALSLCQDFLVAEMDPDSCLDVLALAEAYGLGELAKKAEEFILSHFERVAARPKFLDLPAAQLAHLLAKDSLYVSSEVEVFRVVVAWLEEEWGARLPFLAELLKQVRFPLMAPRELQEVEVTAQILIQAPGCREILEGIRSARQPREISSCQPRMPNQVLVLVGGDHVKDDFSRRVPSAAVQFAHRFLAGMGLIRKVEWRALSHMPTPARFRHAMCVLNNQLYIFGGRKYYGQRDILKSVLRYDPAHDTWEELADMQQQRNNFAVVCLEGVMYAIGGNLDDTEYLDSVECYTHEDNTWRFTQPLPSALCGHAAAVYDGEIYISGGCDGQNHCLGSMWHYHPVLGCTPRAPMRGERAGHVMEVVCSHLYVAGGLYPLAGGFGDQLACESYDPASDSWGPVASLPMPHLSPASVVLNGHIYVLGGSSCQTCQDSHLVHCYDPQSDCWANVGMMQRAYADIAACVLLVPGHLRQ